MQEECYVFLHCDSSTSTQAEQFSSILHPALRELNPSKQQRTATSFQNLSPSLLRSNSAPEHIDHQTPQRIIGFRRMNSSSSGSVESTKINVNSRYQQPRDYRNHHHNQQQQHNKQVQPNRPRNGHIFRQSQAERFTYPGFSTAGLTYNTYWTPTSDGNAVTSLPESRPSVHIPALDLTAITLDDTGHDDYSNTINERGDSDIDHVEGQKSCHFKEEHLMAEESPANRRQKKSTFVFPCEKSLADFDGVKTNLLHAVYEDPASTSPFAQRGRPLSFEDTPVLEVGKQSQQKQPHNQLHNMQKHSKIQELRQDKPVADSKDGQKIIHFSLANHKVEKYIIDEESPSSPTQQSPNSLNEPQRTRESVASALRSNEVDCSSNSPRNEGYVRRASDSAHNVQEILDVVVVDGHLHVDINEKVNDEDECDNAVEILKLEKLNTEISKEKPKPRVTFSFDHEIQSCRSLKRYTPVKMDIKPLQGVLKKRPEPTKVLDSNENDLLEGSKQTYFNDSNSVFRKSSKPDAADQGGIRVKHLHTTSFDISREAGRRGANIPSTMQVAEKPPIPVSRRVAVAAAENAGTDIDISRNGNNNNLLFTGGLTYICSNAQGRVAYFRPADGTSGARDSKSMKVKSRSTEDVNRGDAARFFSSAPTYNNQTRSGSNSKAVNRTSAISSPYSLCRSVSTDHGFSAVVARDGTGVSEVGNTKPAKPRVAFGSFIVPKETTPRVKKAQIKYQEVESSTRPMLSNNGTYVHTHTRRTSPYSPPTQVLYERSGSTSGSSGFRRPYTAQVNKASRVQKGVSNRNFYKDSPGLAQRHSAPSSFSSVKDRAWRASVARQRISIDSSPSQGGDTGTKEQEGPSSGASGSFLLPSKVRQQQASGNIQGVSGVTHVSTRKLLSGPERLGVRTLSRPDLSALNMLANKDKGVSQTRFLATLNKTQNRE